MIPANFTARRYEDAHQAQALADWCGGTVHDGDTRLLPVILVPAGEVASPGDWVILAADGTVRTGRPGSQDGYCADCGQPVWWHDEQLVDRDTNRWCFGPGRTRVAMERWHALPGMHQYIAAAPAGQPCQCLVRSGPHQSKPGSARVAGHPLGPVHRCRHPRPGRRGGRAPGRAGGHLRDRVPGRAQRRILAALRVLTRHAVSACHQPAVRSLRYLGLRGLRLAAARRGTGPAGAAALRPVRLPQGGVRPDPAPAENRAVRGPQPGRRAGLRDLGPEARAVRFLAAVQAPVLPHHHLEGMTCR
jgi:hypothetical protein